MSAGAGVPANRQLLFVYGLLRRGFELHHHLTRLGARFLAEAKVAARLYRLRCYRGARPTSRRGNWVRGEIFELHKPAHSLKVLDKVEEFMPYAPERSEFVRARVEVVMNNGGRQQAWIYWLGPRRVAHG